jgi:lysophospholipase L1-like esterase
MFIQTTEFAEFTVLTANTARKATSRETNIATEALPWGGAEVRIESNISDVNYPGNLGELRLHLTPDQARALGEALLAVAAEPVR